LILEGAEGDWMQKVRNIVAYEKEARPGEGEEKVD